MAKGKTANRGKHSTFKYKPELRRGRNKVRNIERELVKASARVRKIASRCERGIISDDAAHNMTLKQNNHIANLEKELERLQNNLQPSPKGNSGHRPGFS